MDRKPGTSRRNLLRACLAGALSGRAAVPGKSRVVIARDPALRKRMGAVNRQLAVEKYDMPIIAGKIDSLYQELITG